MSVSKELAKKVQKSLKELGYDAPLGHAYELLARLADAKSWNVASKVPDVEARLSQTLSSHPADDESTFGEGNHVFEVELQAYSLATKPYRIRAENQDEASRIMMQYIDLQEQRFLLDTEGALDEALLGEVLEVSETDKWVTIGGRINEYKAIAERLGLEAAIDQIRKEYGSTSDPVVTGLKIFLKYGSEKYYGLDHLHPTVKELLTQEDYFSFFTSGWENHQHHPVNDVEIGSMRKVQPDKVTQFTKYVWEFYKPGGVWGDIFMNTLEPRELRDALDLFHALEPNPSYDTIDRERVRDIILDLREKSRHD